MYEAAYEQLSQREWGERARKRSQSLLSEPSERRNCSGLSNWSFKGESCCSGSGEPITATSLACATTSRMSSAHDLDDDDFYILISSCIVDMNEDKRVMSVLFVGDVEEDVQR